MTSTLYIQEPLDRDGQMSWYMNNKAICVRAYDGDRPDEVWEVALQVKFERKLDVDQEVEIEFYKDEIDLSTDDLLDEIEKGMRENQN